MFNNETAAHIARVAKSIGLEPAAVLAVAEVESAGKAFAVVNGKQEPLIRFEGHYFDRLVGKDKRASARRAGLADPRVGAVKNPNGQPARYAMLERAMDIDRDAAIMSVSWGLGQVMGEHWKMLGFSSPTDLMATARSGVAGQVLLMAKFISENAGLKRALKNHDWASFARGYNGPAYKKNRYDVKMAEAYARLKKLNIEPAPEPLPAPLPAQPKPEPSPPQFGRVAAPAPEKVPTVAKAGFATAIVVAVSGTLWSMACNMPDWIIKLFQYSAKCTGALQ